MQLAQVLDIVEALLNASRHPDIAEVRRYGLDTAGGGQSPAGVAVHWAYGTGAASRLAGTTVKVESSFPTPDAVPPPSAVLSRLPVFVARLLDAAKPEQLRAWELVALKGIGPTDQQGQVVGGIRIAAADGSSVVLHSSYGSGQTREPEVDPHPEYRFPPDLAAAVPAPR